MRKRGKWEPHLLSALTEAMDRASVLFGLPKSHVALLDVGANVGVHTTYMQAAGYKVRRRERRKRKRKRRRERRRRRSTR